jgi:hypothetical protein
MMVVGKGAEGVDRNFREDDFFIDEIIEINNAIFKEETNDLDLGGLPTNSFFIYDGQRDRIGSPLYFIILNQNNDDCPVFSMECNGDFSIVYESLWDWINDYFNDKI